MLVGGCVRVFTRYHRTVISDVTEDRAGDYWTRGGLLDIERDARVP